VTSTVAFEFDAQAYTGVTELKTPEVVHGAQSNWHMVWLGGRTCILEYNELQVHFRNMELVWG
jgi:hypothetical protein